ncbi:MAG TPA: NAD kinase [Saprospiraceae bacterium]|nr:NAD kinase [Saprospiraceae bacterium]
MKVLFFARKVSESNYGPIGEIFAKFEKAGIEISLFEPLLNQLHGYVPLPNANILETYEPLAGNSFDYLVVLGGDGSILDATLLVKDSGIPILGINLGRLGFLASIEKSMVDEVIKAMLHGTMAFEERSMLSIRSNLPLFAEANFALNDFTILKRDTSSMINIHTFVNGDYLTTYWADGLILSTPTGSTAYSLSCGGPIMFPSSDSFVITPVAPHNLNVRPLIVPDTAVVSFQVEGRSDNFLCTMDTRLEMITSAHEIAIKKNDFSIRLARLTNSSFLRGLREKLAWGKDKRNF